MKKSILLGVGCVGVVVLGAVTVYFFQYSRKFEVIKSEELLEEREAMQQPKAQSPGDEERKKEGETSAVPPQAPQVPKQPDTPAVQTQEEKKSTPVEPTSSGGSVTQKLVSWGFSVSDGRKIDSIIVHSSYNALGGDTYDVDAIIAIYKSYSVSPHYIIGRDGKVRQLVLEKNIAYHAGVAKLPDGRSDVNAVSIGIEMVNDDKGDAYTDKQYIALNGLIADIKSRYSIRYILGHSDIASGRKTDPWNFDWVKISGKKF